MNRKEQVEELIIREVVSRGIGAAITFIFVAAITFFYGFGCKINLPLIRVFCVLVILLSAYRYYTSKKFLRSTSVPRNLWKRLHLSIWINSFCWTVIFYLVVWETNLKGEHFINVLILITAFASSSLFTVGYDTVLFTTYQFALLGPLILIGGVLGAEGSENGFYLSIFSTIFLVYQLRQSKRQRELMIKRFNFQLDVEESNSELKKSQSALMDQTAKLIHTSRLVALGEMSAGMAHEINNPLTIISGSMQKLNRLVTANTWDAEKFKEILTRADNSVMRISKIIGSLKHFSQQSDLQPKEEVSLSFIINDTISFCGELLKAREIDLQIDPIPNYMIRCRSVQISQVLINLLKNAQDAIIDSSSPEKWIKIKFAEKNKFVEIQVINPGPLIPSDVREKMFQPFFTTKITTKGTGLGLSISRGIMNEHGGDLILEENTPHTTFSLLLPFT